MENIMIAPKEQNKPSITRKIGKTTYKVNMHFKSDGNTDIGDCLKRVVIHDLSKKGTKSD